MNKKEFIEKFHLDNWDIVSSGVLIASLDRLYLEFTKEQVIEIVSAFYDNADDIFNSLQEELEEKVREMSEEFELEEEKIIDKTPKA